MRVFSAKFVMLGALLTTAVAVPAIAQQPAATSKYPECPANFAANQNEQEAARGAWLAGKAAFDEADYAKAIDYFKDAYKRDCSKHVLLREWIARAYEAKGDKAEAINALETYLARMPKADDADQVRKRIDNLKQALGQGTSVPTGTGPATTGTTAPTTTATTAPTTTATDTPPPPATPGVHTLPPWIVVGVGGAALVGGVVMILVGSGKISDSHTQCPNNVCPGSYTSAQIASAQSLNTSGHSLQNAGFIVGGIGVAAVAGGLVWHFMEPFGGKKTAFSPVVAPGYAGAALQHQF